MFDAFKKLAVETRERAAKVGSRVGEWSKEVAAHLNERVDTYADWMAEEEEEDEEEDEDEASATATASSASNPSLPWTARTPQERHLERRFRARVLEITRERRDAFLDVRPTFSDASVYAEGAAREEDHARGEETTIPLSSAAGGAGDAAAEAASSSSARENEDAVGPFDVRRAAGALASDRALRELRFRLVPKVMCEEAFWTRYFALVESALAEVRAEDAAERAAAAEAAAGRAASNDDASGGSSGAASDTRVSGDGQPRRSSWSATTAAGGTRRPPSIADVKAADLRVLAGAIDSARSVSVVGELIRNRGAGGGAEGGGTGAGHGEGRGGGVGAKLTLRSGRMPPPPSADDVDGDGPSGDRRGSGGMGAAKRAAAALSRAAAAAAAAAVTGGKRTIERVMTRDVSQDEAQELLYELFDSSFGTSGAVAADAVNDAENASDDAFVSTRLPDGPSLAADVSGAPTGGLLAGIAAAMASMPSTSDMARLYEGILDELTWHWENRQPVPRVPPNDKPDVRCCLMHQQLQLLNCCITRRRAREAAENFAPYDNAEDASRGLEAREGVKGEARKSDLMLLETGEPLRVPLCQEGPVLTTEGMREAEELTMKRGSMGMGAAQLFSDMQAFKAANPGAVLADFVRWYSPPDWIEGHEGEEATGLTPKAGAAAVSTASFSLADDEDDSDEEHEAKTDGKDDEIDGASDAVAAGIVTSEGSTPAGRLSRRMQEPGNLWLELWGSAQPVPAMKQSLLFDHEHAGEEVLESLRGIAPSSLFEQLFVVALGVAHAAAVDAGHPARESDRSDAAGASSVIQEGLAEVAAYASSVCVPGMSSSKVRQLCDTFQRLEDLVEGRFAPPPPPRAPREKRVGAMGRIATGPAVVLGGAVREEHLFGGEPEAKDGKTGDAEAS